MVDVSNKEVDIIAGNLAAEKYKRKEIEELLKKEMEAREKITVQYENLQNQFFQKNQQLKVADDRIAQLQNNNTYRQEVVRLEELVQNLEAERKDLDEYVKKQDTEIGMIKGNLSDLMTENVVLKNAVKVQKKQVSASNMQTENLGTHQSDCGVQTDDQKPVTEKADCETCVQSFMTGFGIDFGIDTGTQTDTVHETAQGDCKKCVSNVELINELIELLGIIEKNIVYAQSVGFQQDMKELVTRPGKVEEEIS